jgi:hypothetical protein
MRLEQAIINALDDVKGQYIEIDKEKLFTILIARMTRTEFEALELWCKNHNQRPIDYVYTLFYDNQEELLPKFQHLIRKGD